MQKNANIDKKFPASIIDCWIISKYKLQNSGGKDTSTLVDGKSLLSESELSQLGVLKLQECIVLENSYLRLRYKMIH